MKQVLRRKIWKLPVWAWLGLLVAFLIVANLPQDEEQVASDVPVADAGSGQAISSDEASEAESVEAGAQPYAYDVLSHRDVSYAGVTRYADRIVIAEDEVDRDRLLVTLSQHVDPYRGEANAVAVTVHGDPREELAGTGAWGTWDWAPGGDWGRADEGDPETWSGYDWSAADEPGKLDDPTNCERPTDEAYDVSESHDKLRADQPDAEEATLVDVVAAETGLSASEVNDRRISVLDWLRC